MASDAESVKWRVEVSYAFLTQRGKDPHEGHISWRRRQRP